MFDMKGWNTSWHDWTTLFKNHLLVNPWSTRRCIRFLSCELLNLTVFLLRGVVHCTNSSMVGLNTAYVIVPARRPKLLWPYKHTSSPCYEANLFKTDKQWQTACRVNWVQLGLRLTVFSPGGNCLNGEISCKQFPRCVGMAVIHSPLCKRLTCSHTLLYSIPVALVYILK